MKKIVRWVLVAFFKIVAVAFFPPIILGTKLIRFVDDELAGVGMMVLFGIFQLAYWVLIIDALFIREIIK